MHALNAPNNIAKVTNQWGAIPISLLNSHFHSSIGTTHSKTCITLPSLPHAAQHDNQVNTFSPHFFSHTKPGGPITDELVTHSSMSQSSGDEWWCVWVYHSNEHGKYSFHIPKGNVKCDCVQTHIHTRKQQEQGNTCIHKYLASSLPDSCMNTPSCITLFDRSVTLVDCSVAAIVMHVTTTCWTIMCCFPKQKQITIKTSHVIWCDSTVVKICLHLATKNT